MEARDIRTIRKEGLNWTQEQFARELGVSKASIHNWESGRRRPSSSVLKKMNKVFDTKLAVLNERNYDDERRPKNCPNMRQRAAERKCVGGN